MKFKMLLLGLMAMSSVTLTSYAAMDTNTTTPTTQNAQQQTSPMTEAAMTDAIKKLFEWVNANATSSASVSENQFTEFFTPNVVYEVNGQQVASSVQALYQHFQHLKATRTSYSVTLPISAVVADDDDNEAALIYKVNVTLKDGTQRTAHCAAVIKFQNGKIANWKSIDAYPKLEQPRQLL